MGEQMNADSRGKRTAAATASRPQERLVVEDGENMHVLGRFFQAMLLNLLKEPSKVKAAEGMDLTVAVDPSGHPDNALTMTFSGGRVILESGIVPDADIVLKCETAVLMKLARIPAGPAVVGFLRTHEGKALVARMRSGELKIKGITRHPLMMMRFSKFLAPSAG